jgi:flagellar hook-associated protein 1 FlgK
MADLLSILAGASSSLAAQRGLAATASHNIDNAANPGYARQRAVIEALTPAEQVGGVYIGRGATLGAVTQARDRFLEAQVPQTLGSAGHSSAESDALQAFHALDPQTTGGLGDAISGFYSGLRALAQNPSDPGLRTASLGQAQVLAQTFNRTAQSVELARTGLDDRAQGLVQAINSETAAVAQLNGQIQAARGNGGSPNDLLDLRQGHLDKLAELTGATPVPTSDGGVDVVLAGGGALVSGTRAGMLTTQVDPANLGHLQVRLGQPDGSPPQPVPAGMGGTLGGTLSARDGALKQAGVDVDQLAFDLAGQVNAAHAAHFGLDGSTGNPLFTTAAGAAGTARAMAVAITGTAQLATSSLTSGTPPVGVPGDGGGAKALLDTERAKLSGNADVQTTLSTVISSFGGTAATSKAFSEQDAALKDQLMNMRQSYSGVSIDEEMIALQNAQRGYEAVTKVMKTVDEMMQTLMSLKS